MKFMLYLNRRVRNLIAAFVLACFISQANILYAQDKGIVVNADPANPIVTGIQVMDDSATDISIGPGAPGTALRSSACFAVRKAEGDIILKAIIAPDIPETPGIVTWTGGQSVEGHPFLRAIPKTEYGKFTVVATVGNNTRTMLVYVVGADTGEFRPRNGTSDTFRLDDEARPYQTDNMIYAMPDAQNPNIIAQREVQFIVQPSEFIEDGNAGLFNKEQIEWDTTRTVRLKMWSRLVGQTLFVPINETFYKGQMVSSDEWASDDTTNIDEDNNPWDGNGHLYSTDQPTFSFGAPSNAVVIRVNFKEWVTINGEKCSDELPNHTSVSVQLNGNGVWETSNDYGGCEIGEGNIFWGDTP